ncbi:MAG: site-2 protease family protein [Syntrophobacteraceae bacterium]
MEERGIDGRAAWSGEGPETLPAASSSGARAKSRRSGIIGVLLVAAGFLLKTLKPLLLAVKAFKFGFFLKTGLSMIVSMWAYAMAWGWAYGAAFVLLIFVHEMGHVYALKEFGVQSSVPVFIPFFGAFIAMKEMPKNVRIEAWTAIAGPLVGTGAATLCWSAALYYGSSFFLAVAYTGFFLNLFNLIPLSPLDGGRVAAAISPKVWVIGVAILLIMLFRSFNPVLLLVFLLAGRNAYGYWKRKDGAGEGYYEVDAKTKMQISVLYFGLVAFLTVAMMLTHRAA